MSDLSPTTIVIFGATGDLFKKKLASAFLDLFVRNALPETVRVIGFSRKNLSHEDFRKFVKEAIDSKEHNHDDEKVDEFLQKFFYEQGDINDVSTYKKLAGFLAKVDEKLKFCTNKLFYLAVPPNLYEPVFNNLSESGLTVPCGGEEGWTRVLVEKPFGKNLKHAQKLDSLLGKLFAEEQIFRIDHYLAKETVQNLLTFRFSNKLFEPIWNKDHIEKVEIKMLEEGDASKRASFYDGIGALRDVGQNHLLQMLALIAMEDPKELNPNLIRRERMKILEKVLPGDESISKYALRGQYKCFKDEVGNETDTETYFKVKLSINSERWNGVPFVLESGKALSESIAEIVLHFKTPISCVCPPGGGEHPNVLTFRIQPEEGISIKFWAKKPGFDFGLEPKLLSFSYEENPSEERIPDAYERVLFDCIKGDQTLFTSTDEVKAEWNIITPILEHWAETELYQYDKGSIIDKKL